MSTTEQYPDFSGYTFEKVWASIQESRREFQESRREFQEEMRKSDEKAAREMQESRLKFQEEMRISHEKAEKEMQELREQMKATDLQIKETDRRLGQQLGRLGNRLGEFMESVVRPGLDKKFNELGYSFDGESHNLIIKDPVTKQRQTELDIILENGDSVVVIEVKLNPCNEDVEHFAEQLQYYRDYRNRNIPNDTKKIFGALAAAVFPDAVQKLALDLGYYVIVPSGESIKIVVPEKVGLKAF